MRVEWGEDELSVWFEFNLDYFDRRERARQAEHERLEQNARAVAWWRTATRRQS